MSDMNDCLNRSKNRDKACSHLSAIAEVNGKFPELQVRETRVSFSARAAVRRLMFQPTQGSERDDGKNERSGTFATRRVGSCSHRLRNCRPAQVCPVNIGPDILASDATAAFALKSDRQRFAESALSRKFLADVSDGRATSGSEGLLLRERQRVNVFA